MESSEATKDNQSIDYQDLQRRIDQVIGKIGLKNTYQLLISFIETMTIPIGESHKRSIISQYIIMESIRVFELQEEMFFTSMITEYREARMAGYHLIKKYTDASYPMIAEDFGLTKRNVLYGHQKCEERLSVPYFYKTFQNKYDTLEGSVIDFISKLITKNE